MIRSCGLSPTNARCIVSYCVTFMNMSATYIQLKIVFIPRGEESGLQMCLGYNKCDMCQNRIGLAKFKVQNGANPEKGKQHDSSDETFQIVPTTDENWQTRSDLSASVCSLLLFVVIGYAAVNLKLFQEVDIHVLSNRRTSARAQLVHGLGIVHVLFSF